jgi:glycosyltransferase involved in cell wall biosynthesis
MRAIIRADLTPPEAPFGRFEGRALRLKDLLVDAVVVGAGENRESFAQALGRKRGKVQVIHTGIPLDRFDPGAGGHAVRQSLGLREPQLLVGTLCRLSDRRKGVHDFVAMAAKVASECPDARFVVVGDGVLRRELEDLATSLGLKESLTFAGWTEDARAWYAAMDVFVMASTHEGGPTTLLEAMAMGGRRWRRTWEWCLRWCSLGSPAKSARFRTPVRWRWRSSVSCGIAVAASGSARLRARPRLQISPSTGWWNGI